MSSVRTGGGWRRAAAGLVGYVWPPLVVSGVATGITGWAAGGEWIPEVAELALVAAVGVWLGTSRLIPRERGTPWRRLQVAAGCLAPLLPTNLLFIDPASHLPPAAMTLALSLAVGGLLGTSSYVWALERFRRGSARLAALCAGPVVIWVLIAAFTVTYLGVSLSRWWLFRQGAQDMGIYHQALYNTLHGRFLSYSTDFRFAGTPLCRLGDHCEPLLLAFLPLYAVWATPVWLLVAQVLGLAWGAVPVARLARRWYSPSAGAVAAFVYLTFPGLDRALYSDFHVGVLALPLVLWGLYLGLERRYFASAIALVLAMAGKESIPGNVLMVGLYLAWRGERRYGLATCVGALVCFALAMGVVIPHFSPTGHSLYGGLLHDRHREALAWGQWAPVAAYLVKRVEYLLYLGGGVSELWLVSPVEFLLAAPDLLMAMAGGMPAMVTIGGHYHVMILTGFVLGGVRGLSHLRSALSARAGCRGADIRRALLIGFAGAAFTFALNSYSLLSTRPSEWLEWPTEEGRRQHRLLAAVPDEVPVLTNMGALAAYLGRRELLVLDTNAGEPAAVPRASLDRVRYLVLWVRDFPDQPTRAPAPPGLRLIGHAGELWVWEV